VASPVRGLMLAARNCSARAELLGAATEVGCADMAACGVIRRSVRVCG